jgi:hypothetical protein
LFTSGFCKKEDEQIIEVSPEKKRRRDEIGKRMSLKTVKRRKKSKIKGEEMSSEDSQEELDNQMKLLKISTNVKLDPNIVQELNVDFSKFKGSTMLPAVLP